MAKILGWLTIVGLALIAIAIGAHVLEVAYPVPFILASGGAACSLLTGIPWAHTRGKSRLKTAFLGLVGFAIGAPCGLFLGDAATTSLGEKDLGIAIFSLIAGFWVGGFLCAFFGVWWGRRFRRDSGA
jgi:hypothetical protein